MKKFYVGLLIAAAVLVVLGFAAGAFFYFRVYAPSAPVVTLVSAVNLEERGLRETDFTPPANDELTEAQVAAFAAVERAVEHRLGAHLADVRTAYEQLVPADQSTRRVPARAALDAFRPVRMPFLAAKHAQIDAMNTAALSKQEYEWVRLRVYQSAGVQVRQVDFTGILEDLRNGLLRMKVHGAAGSAPPRNVELTRALAPDLERWLPLAFWGL